MNKDALHKHLSEIGRQGALTTNSRYKNKKKEWGKKGANTRIRNIKVAKKKKTKMDINRDYTFAFGIGERVTITEYGLTGTVNAIWVGKNKPAQYSVEWLNKSGEISERWLHETELKKDGE
jgi:hypothetical protein